MRLLIVLACVLAVSAQRTLNQISPQRAIDCKNNTFFPLPTAKWTDPKTKKTVYYLIEAGPHSANKFCQLKKLSAAARVRKTTLASTELVGRAMIYNLQTKKFCNKASCYFIALVECMPTGGQACTADSKGNENIGAKNVGTKNVGYMNIGHRNEGLANLGSDNKGDTNVGNENHGDHNIGCRNEGQKLRGWDLDGIGYYASDVVKTFATCIESSVVVPK